MTSKRINTDNTPTPERSREEWLALSERYFDATTSEQEEAELKRFVLTSTAQGEEFEELRAVLSFLAIKRKERVQASKQINLRSILRAAAVAVLIGLGGAWGIYTVDESRNSCIAYIDGVRHTDTDLAFQQMQQSMQSLQLQEPMPSMENQLKDLLNTIEQ